MPAMAIVVACLTLSGAIPTTTSGNEVTPYDKRTYLEKRAIVAGQLCANIPVTVPGNFITGPIVSRASTYPGYDNDG